MKQNINVSNLIKSERKNKGLTQKQFADEIKFSTTYINKLENCRMNVHDMYIKLTKQLINELHVTQEEFIGEGIFTYEDVKEFVTINQRIKHLRDLTEIKINAFCNRLEIDIDLLQSIEANEIEIKDELLNDLCLFFCIKKDELLKNANYISEEVKVYLNNIGVDMKYKEEHSLNSENILENKFNLTPIRFGDKEFVSENTEYVNHEQIKDKKCDVAKPNYDKNWADDYITNGTEINIPIDSLQTNLSTKSGCVRNWFDNNGTVNHEIDKKEETVAKSNKYDDIAKIIKLAKDNDFKVEIKIVVD